MRKIIFFFNNIFSDKFFDWCRCLWGPKSIMQIRFGKFCVCYKKLKTFFSTFYWLGTPQHFIRYTFNSEKKWFLLFKCWLNGEVFYFFSRVFFNTILPWNKTFFVWLIWIYYCVSEKHLKLVFGSWHRDGARYSNFMNLFN